MYRKDYVSVVIPTYNRKEIVTRCIKSVIDSTYDKIEIIIVDNASTDDTLVELEKLRTAAVSKCRDYMVVPLAENAMASGGRNAGILEASGDYILFVDDDNEIYPDMISVLVNALKQESQIGLAAPLAFQDGKSWTTSISFNWWTSKCFDIFPEGVGKTEEYANKHFKKRYKTLAGSPNAFMVSRAALDSVGGFDFSMYMTFEESDFACRIIRAGFEEYIYTDARTNHFGWIRDKENTRLRRLCLEPANRAFYFCRNRTVFMKRYAKWYNLLVYYFTAFHFFWVGYSLIAIYEKRFDIALSIVKGAWAGLFVKNDKRIYIPIDKSAFEYK